MTYGKIGLYGEETPITVTALNEYIKTLLEGTPFLNRVYLCGEISNFKHHSSGHLYFSLKDEACLIRAVMFRSAASRLGFVPREGMKVTVRGSVSLFPRDGSYQIYVTSMEEDGKGALYIAFERLKRQLSEEGLFDAERKRPLPRFPKKIGVITSPTGAAVRDILHVLGRRYSLAEVLLYPALVQGKEAPLSLIEGLRYFNREKSADVLIIGRGGGSFEDLCAFNDEALAREIAASSIPTISAVGHETDFTIADFVADMRAPTPSAAAEIAVPDVLEIRERLYSYGERARLLIKELLEKKRIRLEELSARPFFVRPLSLLDDKRMMLVHLSDALSHAATQKILLLRTDFSKKAGMLEAMSPLAILSRGYAALQDENGKTVTSVEEIVEGERLCLLFANGKADAVVEKIYPDTDRLRRGEDTL